MSRTIKYDTSQSARKWKKLGCVNAEGKPSRNWEMINFRATLVKYAVLSCWNVALSIKQRQILGGNVLQICEENWIFRTGTRVEIGFQSNNLSNLSKSQSWMLKLSSDKNLSPPVLSNFLKSVGGQQGHGH